MFNIKYICSIIFIIMLTNTALAANVDIPDFLPDVKPDELGDAGKEVWGWIVAAFVLLIALCAIAPGVLAIKGERDKAKELAINILYGAGLFIALPSIAIGIVKALAN